MLRSSNHFAIIQAGAVLANLHGAVAEHGLIFPLFFRRAGLIGGALAGSTGGSKILRYGNACNLCLGVDAVLSMDDAIV